MAELDDKVNRAASRRMALACLVACLATGCGDAGDVDRTDAAWAIDAARADASGADAGGSGPDASRNDAGADATAIPDATIPDALPPPDAMTDLVDHVHIYVSNTCVMTVMPTSFDVPAGSTLRLDWHNHSADYPVDVWKSYGGGYLDLATGDTWSETYEHCAGPIPATEYADISTACSAFRVYINCL